MVQHVSLHQRPRERHSVTRPSVPAGAPSAARPQHPATAASWSWRTTARGENSRVTCPHGHKRRKSESCLAGLTSHLNLRTCCPCSPRRPPLRARQGTMWPLLTVVSLICICGKFCPETPRTRNRLNRAIDVTCSAVILKLERSWLASSHHQRERERERERKADRQAGRQAERRQKTEKREKSRKRGEERGARERERERERESESESERERERAQKWNGPFHSPRVRRQHP